MSVIVDEKWHDVWKLRFENPLNDAESMKINESGNTYDVDEIESWFENEGSWKNKDVRTRIVNISHYSQAKFEQTNKFRIVDDSCGDGDSCSCGH